MSELKAFADLAEEFNIEDFYEEYDFLHTGNLALDYLCSFRCDGSGGIPFGTITEIFGDPQTGKTLLILKMGAEVQKRGGIFYIDDSEYTLNRQAAERLGVETDKKKGNYFEVHSDTIEDFADTALEFMKEKKSRDPDAEIPMVMALDSIAELTTKAEKEKGSEDQGKRAKFIKMTVRRLRGEFPKNRAIFIVSNHVIASPNPMQKRKEAPGGGGLRFGAFNRIELLKAKTLETKSGRAFGCKLHARIAKTKEAFGMINQDIDITNYFATGPSLYSGLIPLLATLGYVEKKGGWYKYEGESYREDDLLDKLVENEEWLKEITEDSLKKLDSREVIKDADISDSS